MSIRRAESSFIGKTVIGGLRNVFTIPHDDPELLKAQYTAFVRQIPLLYIILVTNTWILSGTYWQAAPLWLTFVCPLVLSIVCLTRVVQWWRRRNDGAEPAKAGVALSRTFLLSGPLAAAFSIWSIGLFPFGTAEMQAHIAFYIAITVICCIFCLTHLRPAAFSVTVVVNTVFILFFAATGSQIFQAMSLNLAMVSAAMLAILSVNYRDFTLLVRSRRELQVTQAQTQALSDENFRLANLDSLTNLPNRRSFFSALNQRVAGATLTTPLTLGVLDLDGFKPINDTHGHATGDALLQAIADRLRSVCGDGGEIFRLGGDEFAILFSDASAGEVIDLGEAICSSLRQAFELPNCTVRISGTVGLAVYPDMAGSGPELFERADYAMYRAKYGTGRGRPWYFGLEDELAIRRSSLIEQALRTGDLQAELYLAFQPIVDAATEDLLGFEALARWNNPELGLVSPAEFIAIAERSGAMAAITPILLHKALEAAAQWPERLRLSFNLSIVDLATPAALRRVLGLIASSRIATDRLDLEITETAILNDFQALLHAVQMLKQTGASISLDDFGTGYTSLRQVQELPLDRLKIDRSFITGLDQSPASQKIVKLLASLCDDLGIQCLVEGVETAAELATVRQIGCHQVQGFYFGRPMPEAALAGFIADWDGRADRAAG
jgi:diguanylate cyclase (GGDEF)-like protein